MQWPRHVSERKTAASNIHSVPNNPSEESCPQQAANTGRKSKQTRKSLSTRPLPPGRQTSSRVGLEDPGTQGQTRRGKGCLLHARAAATRFPPRPGRRPDIQGTEAPTLAWTGASTPDTCDEPAACRDLEDTGPWACRHSQGTRFASDGVTDMQTGNF